MNQFQNRKKKRFLWFLWVIGFHNLSPLLVIKNPSKSHRFVASTEVENEGPDKSCTTISFYGCLLLSHLIFNLIPIKETKIALNLKAFSNTDKLINILLERQLRYMFSCRSICIICITTLFYLLPRQLNVYSQKQQQLLGQESPSSIEKTQLIADNTALLMLVLLKMLHLSQGCGFNCIMYQIPDRRPSINYWFCSICRRQRKFIIDRGLLVLHVSLLIGHNIT